MLTDSLAETFSFPRQINEKAARTVAFVVLVLAVITLSSDAYWLLVPLAYGFVARVLTGPTLSPLGRLASSVIAPRLGSPHYVPGPPKRFAQAIGASITTAAAIAALVFHANALADGLLVLLILAAGLESLFAVCLGCQVFSLLMRAGVVPAEICAECADIWGRGAASGVK